jgi:mono/diheme cytochrome c family protein
MKIRKVLSRLGLGVTLFVSGCVALTAARQDRTFDAPKPDLHASRDPAVIARGSYLVNGAAHCADCHAAPEREADVLRGEEVPLSGGRAFHLPVGTFHVPNLSPDPETGIGRYSDEELARALRYDVHPTGRVMLPFMPFNDLADDDLTAIISYLRAQPPVPHAVPGHEVNAAGKLVKAWVIEPRGPEETPKKTMKPEPTAAYGDYLANHVGNCVGCHTKVNMRTGKLEGPKFGGGAIHESTKDPKRKFVSPNLTPDPTSGWITDWSEDMFVARMHAGRVHDGSPMPWPSFEKMTDDDLRAIYRYLRSLPPMSGGPDPAKRENVLLTASNE